MLSARIQSNVIPCRPRSLPAVTQRRACVCSSSNKGSSSFLAEAGKIYSSLQFPATMVSFSVFLSANQVPDVPHGDTDLATSASTVFWSLPAEGPTLFNVGPRVLILTLAAGLVWLTDIPHFNIAFGINGSAILLYFVEFLLRRHQEKDKEPYYVFVRESWLGGLKRRTLTRKNVADSAKVGQGDKAAFAGELCRLLGIPSRKYKVSFTDCSDVSIVPTTRNEAWSSNMTLAKAIELYSAVILD